MKYDAKLLTKLALIFFGLLFFVYILLGRRERDREAPEGDKISCRDVAILLEALGIQTDGVPGLDGTFGADDTDLTYGQYIAIRQELDGDTLQLPDYGERYETGDALLRADWYTAYRIMLACLDTESSIWETDIFLLKTDGETGAAYTANGTNQTPYHYLSAEFEQNVLREMRVCVKGDQLLTVVDVLAGEYELKNVWVTEYADGLAACFYHQTAFRAETERTLERESVADLIFRDGNLVDAKEKNDKIHGKLLWVSEETLEIEDSGVYPIEEGMEVYKLYGSLETLARTDLRIGYADADYVIERGKICACLVSERETADRIRVLLKNTAKNSNYYDAVELVVDGETIRIGARDLEVGERRIYSCAALTDKIVLHIEGIRKADNAYRGSVECYRDAEGLLLINELPLEEYLYAVVPSEMPASYPPEALKAQAVCARTYAYLCILHAGLPEAGAHVDDTTSYQVYHNCSENTATTTAVKETDGILLTYQGEPAQNYYYSTSCGVGTDAAIWKSGSGQDISYLRAGLLCMPEDIAADHAGETKNAVEDVENIDDAKSIDIAGGTWTPDDLRMEENFRTFITSVGETDLEKNEPWYRWIYTVEAIDAEVMLARIKERYAVSPQSVLTRTEGDYFVSQPIDKLGKIKELDITHRGAGGVADELLIETDAGTYKILAEYNIRCVLCDGAGEVVKQDGSTVVPSSLLPSGFFVIETGKRKGNVVGYTLTGGGYGHGVGMSQNGARALGEEGCSYSRILGFFFPGCELEKPDQDADL